jgi:hypothetical protein
MQYVLTSILIIYKWGTTNSKKFYTNPMCQNSKPPNVTSLLKTNFIFTILSIHTIQTIKYHYLTFSLFNSKFKFLNFSNPSFPPTFSLIPTNITFKFQLTFQQTLNYYFLSFSLFNSKFKFLQTLFFPHTLIYLILFFYSLTPNSPHFLSHSQTFHHSLFSSLTLQHKPFSSYSLKNTHKLILLLLLSSFTTGYAPYLSFLLMNNLKSYFESLLR